jgi:hypothetical protein
MTRPLLLAAALLLAACNTNVDPQFRVTDVRVLAVRSLAFSATPDPFGSADVAPGDTLVLDALVANPRGRPGLAIEWFVCLPRPNEAVSPCEDLATLADPSRLRGLDGVTQLAAGPSTQLLVPALTEALAFVVQTAVERPVFACRMYAEIHVVVVASAEGHRSVAAKAVRVKPPASMLPEGFPDLYTLNKNPAAVDLVRAPISDTDGCLGGTEVGGAPFPAGKTTLCGTDLTGSVEAYDVCEPTGGFSVQRLEETLTWQWYASDGDFPDVGGVGNVRGDHVDFVRPAGAFTLWGILRDGRGGVDWVSVAVPAL